MSPAFHFVKPPDEAAGVGMWTGMGQDAQAPVTHQTSVMILRLPGGAQIELADLKQVPLAAALLRALEKPCWVFPTTGRC
jgi:hypothetical protein